MRDDDLLPRARRRRRPDTWYGTTGMAWTLDIGDPRRSWQDVTPETGLTLRQAMLHYGPADRAEEFYGLERQGYDGDPPMLVGVDGWPTDPKIVRDFDMKARWLREARARLEYCLVEKLVTGRLTATGYAQHDPLDEPARVIVADRWRTLEPDFERSQATVAGTIISGILVFGRRARPSRVNAPRRSAQAKVWKWYRDWVKENVALGTQPSREQDLEAASKALGATISRDLLRDPGGSWRPKHGGSLAGASPAKAGSRKYALRYARLPL